MTMGSRPHSRNESLSAVLLDRNGIICEVDFNDNSLLPSNQDQTESLVGRPFTCLHEKDDSNISIISTGVEKVCRGLSESFSYCFKHDNREFYELVAGSRPERTDKVFVTYQKIQAPVDATSLRSLPISDSLNATLLECMPTSVIYQDNQGVVQLANAAAQKILRRTLDELQLITRNKTPWDFFDADHKVIASDELPWMQCLASQKPISNAILGIHDDQRDLVWLKASCDIVLSPGRECIGVLTNLVDITNDREIQFELQAQTTRTQVAVENANLGVWDWIPNGDHMIWDKKMFQLYGYPDDGSITPQEVWRQALHKDDFQHVKEEVHSLMHQEMQKNVKFRTVWPDGTIHYLSARAKVIRDASGRVERMVGVTHDVTNDVMAERKLWDLAYTDNLTSVFSRAGLNFRLSRTIARCLKSDAKFCVVMMGLVRFKEINENYGISAGDKILIEVARRAKAMLSEEDTVARVGGDEFALVLESVNDEEQIPEFVNQFRDAVLKPVLLSDGLSVNLDAAIGVSVFPDDGYDTSALQTNASLAMHNDRSKESPIYMKYDRIMSEEVSRKFNLKYQLYSAVKSNEFQLYYQPIIDLCTGKVIGCEALLRWRDGSGKFVSPVEFIPVVEESGLIYELGKWVNFTAIKQWKLWQQLVPELNYISVNVSPRQLENSRFVDDLIALVEDHRISPGNLQLEITEGTFLQDSLHSQSTLKQLANYGFRLAIDDFGTGYSSLAYLKRFNVDVIKIDRSFIKDIEKDESDRNIVSAILAMNKKLGFKTLVEGVETDDQNSIVQELGCDSAQGYLYGRPTFADEFAEVYIRTALDRDS